MVIKGRMQLQIIIKSCDNYKEYFGATGLYALYEYADNFKTLIPAVTSICYYLGYISRPAIYDVDLVAKFNEL